MPDTLPSWLEWLEALHPHEIEMGLERVRTVVARAGLDRNLPKLVTVAGTNGKGSVVEYLTRSYFCAGFRTGSYTSPHLHVFNERVRINGVNASDTLLCDAFASIEQARGDTTLTYFEYTTLVAMRIFIDQQVDVAILEVGLGGRLDAVNCWDTDCAVITSIAIDHEAFLGSDREVIGFEKAGIARSNTPLVIGELDCPQSVIDHGKAIAARLCRIDQDFSIKATEADGAFLCTLPGGETLRLPSPGLTGQHQRRNAAVAATVITLLSDVLPVKPADIRAGVASARVAGRMQQMTVADRQVFLDVAHNPAAAAMLAKTLAEHHGERSFVAVFGVMQDKDLAGLLDPLAPLVKSWLCTELPVPRALPPSEAAAHIKLHYAPDKVLEFRQIDAALERALGDPSFEGCQILIFGSFFTVAGALEILSDT